MNENIIIHNDDYYYDIVKTNIRKYRKEKNLTQQNLADMVGLTRDYIQAIEGNSRKKYFTLATLGRISDALEIPIQNFFNIEKNQD